MAGLLAPLRFSAADSAGRRYPEVPHPYRNDFQRDRDRIVHSRAFRRLEDKTQVFGAGYSDHFRNRLTHSIEVSQLARTLAGALGLNEDLTEALALVHDVGHPPFAHAGEAELNRQMQRFGERFDHNLHALYIVESFETRYAAFPGLNLTFEVREGIVKHSKDLHPGEIPELDEYLPGLRPPLEAQLIDLADEAAYNTADLDDGFQAGLFTFDEIAAACPACSQLRDVVDSQFPGAMERLRFSEFVRRLVDLFVSGLLEGTVAAAGSAGVANVAEIRAHPARLAAFRTDIARTGAEIKKFLHEWVYNSPELVEERNRSSAAIGELFQFFLDHPDRLPEGYLEERPERDLPRAICDYIAGMTDGFFLRTWRQSLGSS